jgi:uncharacterized protein
VTLPTTSAPEFRLIALDDRARFAHFLAASRFPLCEYTFGSLYCWQGFNHTSFALLNDTWLLVRYVEHGQEKFLCPLAGAPPCPYDIADAIAWCFEYLRQRGFPPQVTFVPEGVVATLDPDRFRYTADLPNADYLYRRTDLAELAGHKYGRKRNFIKRFTNTYPAWSLDPLTPALRGEALNFVTEWCRRNECGQVELLRYEVEALGVCINSIEHLPVQGAVLRVANEIVGLTIGEAVTTELYAVHYEKAFREYDGAYPMLTNQFARTIPATYTYLDREQDVGDESLRKAKESFFPARLEPAYVVQPAA